MQYDKTICQKIQSPLKVSDATTEVSLILRLQDTAFHTTWRLEANV